ncbi:unnamed protein product [Albugo candida]|uniref:Uncharacterized protein n=1 Tax=Albugo candida TaxID=65357 RepID=A0A024G594_9STRA|nr:unnamed protein product [Albugo candida]|eukprot:CCI41901.1 unnamed protein product [Albugo candida]
MHKKLLFSLTTIAKRNDEYGNEDQWSCTRIVDCRERQNHEEAGVFKALGCSVMIMTTLLVLVQINLKKRSKHCFLSSKSTRTYHNVARNLKKYICTSSSYVDRHD